MLTVVDPATLPQHPDTQNQQNDTCLRRFTRREQLVTYANIALILIALASLPSVNSEETGNEEVTYRKGGEGLPLAMAVIALIGTFLILTRCTDE